MADHLPTSDLLAKRSRVDGADVLARFSKRIDHVVATGEPVVATRHGIDHVRLLPVADGFPED